MTFLQAINPLHTIRLMRERRRSRDALVLAYLEYATTLFEKQMSLLAVMTGCESRMSAFDMDKYVKRGRSRLNVAWHDYTKSHGIKVDD